MKLTTLENNLLHLYHCGSAAETAEVIRDALGHINEPDTRNSAESLLQRLESMSEPEFKKLEELYAG